MDSTLKVILLKKLFNLSHWEDQVLASIESALTEDLKAIYCEVVCNKHSSQDL